MQEKDNNINEQKDGFFKRRTDKFKKGVKDNINYEELKSTTGVIKDLASDAFSPKNLIKNAKVENFEKAIADRGLTDFDLISLYKNYSMIFYISIVAMAICFGFSIYLSLVNFSILMLGSLLSIMLVCGANAFKFSFRAFQIKHRKLCSVSDYLAKKEFFPEFTLKP